MKLAEMLSLKGKIKKLNKTSKMVHFKLFVYDKRDYEMLIGKKICHLVSLVMLNSDPHDGYFYQHSVPLKDTLSHLCCILHYSKLKNMQKFSFRKVLNAIFCLFGK